MKLTQVWVYHPWKISNINATENVDLSNYVEKHGIEKHGKVDKIK